MTKEIRRPKGAGPQRCKFIAEQHLDLFVNFIAAKADGSFDIEYLRQQAEDFREHQSLLAPVYRRSYEDCERARKEHEFDDKRSDHLGRLVIRLIADHFVENGAKPPEEGGLSRRIVPGMLSVLELALGADVLKTFQAEAQDIVDRLRETNAEEFEWEDLFADRAAQSLLARLLVDLSISFEDYGRRKMWAIDIINKSMQHDRLDPEDGEYWEFAEVHFHTMIGGLFVPLIAVTDSADKRIEFAAAFGTEKMEAVRDFLQSAALL